MLKFAIKTTKNREMDLLDRLVIGEKILCNYTNLVQSIPERFRIWAML